MPCFDEVNQSRKYENMIFTEKSEGNIPLSNGEWS